MSQTFSIKEQKCQSVVVFQDRAEIQRSITLKLAKGETEVLLTNVSSYIEHDSVRVEGNGMASVVDVICQSKHVEALDLDTNEKAKNLMVQIKEFELERVRLNDRKSRFVKQKATLDQFAASLAGGDSGKTEWKGGKENVENFYGFLETYAERLEKLDGEVSQSDIEIKCNDEKLKVARNNYEKMHRIDIYANEATEIKILIENKSEESSSEEEVTLLVSYIVFNASWTPKYDIRVFGKEQKMIVNYFGMICQTTGEDWTDTKISLSTAVPSIGGNVPELTAENVRIKPKVVPYSNRSYAMKSKSKSRKPKCVRGNRDSSSGGSDQEEEMAFGLFDGDTMPSEPAPPRRMMQMETNVTTSEIGSTSTFAIPRQSTIPSDNETHKVSIALITLQPSIQHESVPRLNTLTFLKAKVTNTSQYSLLPGPANIFLDNNFVAKTNLTKLYSPLEEFEFSLGVDNGVKCLYKPVQRFKSTTGMLKNFTLTTCVQVIEVKNTNLTDVKVVVKDTVPLSNDDKISVKLIEPQLKGNAASGVSMSKLNVLEFDLSLKAGKSEELTIKYSIEHPTGIDIDFF